MFDYLKLLVAYFQEHWILAVNSAATLIALVACGARMHMMWKQRDIIEANTELAFNLKLPWFWPNIIDMFSATILIVFLNLSLLFAFLLGRYSSVLVQTINKPVFLIFWLF